MPENSELIGSVRDTDGRTLEIWVDHGNLRIDYCGQRGFFDHAQSGHLVSLTQAGDDIAMQLAADERAAAADGAQDPEAHTCGVVDLDDEGLCDVPGYCPPCDALRAAGWKPYGPAADPFGPEAYKQHQPGCVCWDCKAAREDEEPGPLELFRQEREEGENR